VARWKFPRKADAPVVPAPPVPTDPPVVVPEDIVTTPPVMMGMLIPYGNGLFVSAQDSREFFLFVDGVRYEHVAETPDGRWVYAAS
jgi:hypothetical protein